MRSISRFSGVWFCCHDYVLLGSRTTRKMHKNSPFPTTCTQIDNFSGGQDSAPVGRGNPFPVPVDRGLRRSTRFSISKRGYVYAWAHFDACKKQEKLSQIIFWDLLEFSCGVI